MGFYGFYQRLRRGFEQGTSITLNDWQNFGKWQQAAILMFKNTVTNAI